ncbi:F-box protein SKIP19-like protein, partial [Tanacetum coccineum]
MKGGSTWTSASNPIRNWLELPSDVTSNILYRTGVIDILENGRKVCTTWRKICKDPAMWRVINMNNPSYSNEMPHLKEMCKHAVDRSQGQLVDITIVDFGDDELLRYVAD